MIELENGGYVVKNYSTEDGLSSDFIYQVFIDSQNRTWFATDGRGVSMLDHSGFHHFAKGLESRVVYSFAEDVNNDIANPVKPFVHYGGITAGGLHAELRT